MGAAAVRTHASRISSSPVSYISESVVIPPREEPNDLASAHTQMVSKSTIRTKHGDCDVQSPTIPMGENISVGKPKSEFTIFFQTFSSHSKNGTFTEMVQLSSEL